MSHYSDAFVNKVVSHYTEEHRHYHNLEHVDNCLRVLEEMYTAGRIADIPIDEVLLMVLYHDIIYDVGPSVSHGSNEMASANCFISSQEAREMDEESARVVYDGILYSARHTEDLNGEEMTESQKLFLDLDVCGMGESYETFLTNGENIRKEYEWVDDNSFHNGRTLFFKNLLGKNRLYYNQRMFDIFEKQTRENIKRWLHEN